MSKQFQNEELSAWQSFYNWQRPHGSLNGKTPSQVVGELCDKSPFWDEVVSLYDIKNERIKDTNYQVDLAIRQLKGCL